MVTMSRLIQTSKTPIWIQNYKKKYKSLVFQLTNLWTKASDQKNVINSIGQSKVKFIIVSLILKIEVKEFWTDHLRLSVKLKIGKLRVFYRISEVCI